LPLKSFIKTICSIGFESSDENLCLILSKSPEIENPSLVTDGQIQVLAVDESIVVIFCFHIIRQLNIAIISPRVFQILQGSARHNVPPEALMGCGFVKLPIP